MRWLGMSLGWGALPVLLLCVFGTVVPVAAQLGFGQEYYRPPARTLIDTPTAGLVPPGTFETRTRVLIQRVDVYRLPPSPMDARSSRRLPDVVWPSWSERHLGILDVWFKDLSDFMPAQTRAYNRRAKHEGLTRLIICRLPTRSPWLMPLESIFGWIKHQILGNRLFQTVAELQAAAEHYFRHRVAQARERRDRAWVNALAPST